MGEGQEFSFKFERPIHHPRGNAQGGSLIYISGTQRRGPGWIYKLWSHQHIAVIKTMKLDKIDQAVASSVIFLLPILFSCFIELA